MRLLLSAAAHQWMLTGWLPLEHETNLVKTFKHILKTTIQDIQVCDLMTLNGH